MRSFFFLGFVAVIYGVLLIFLPDKTLIAFRGSMSIFLRIGIALSLVFFLIFALNLFLKPSHLTNLLGKESGIKGIIVSTLAGIVSVGPIYAWYPLLQELKARGAKDSLIAIFLNNRAVKPVLLPIMISYFGWLYVLIFTLATVLGSLACGFLVGLTTGERMQGI